jgi:hypothetical protein
VTDNPGMSQPLKVGRIYSSRGNYILVVQHIEFGRYIIRRTGRDPRDKGCFVELKIQPKDKPDQRIEFDLREFKVVEPRPQD